MERKFNILGIIGSLRKNSYNKSLMQTAVEMVPSGVDIEPFEIDGIPLFNQDNENKPPEKVKELKAKVRKADAILFATPEYNYSVPGSLKNAIDWVSRPYTDNAFVGKPVGIMGASTGMIGTARAQYHLRQSCVFLNMHPLNKPEVMVAYAADKITNDVVTDEKTKMKIKELLEALVEWTKQLNP
jgi:chromate reductase